MNKRIISMLLMCTMLFSMMCTGFAAGENNNRVVTLTFSADKTQVQPGETINYTVALEKVNDLSNFSFEIVVPNGMTYVEGSGKVPGGLAEAMGYATADWTEQTMMFTAYSDTSYSSNAVTKLMTFSCIVGNTAGEKSIGVSNSGENTVAGDSNYDYFEVRVISDVVTVASGDSEPPVEPDPQPPVEDPSHDNCPSAKFADVNQDLWYHEGIDYVIENGLMNGVGGPLFSPNGTTNRAMIVTILHRLESTPAGADAGFGDVAEGQWYSEAVNWAAENGIVTGYSVDTFGPMNPITREQLAAILYRYAQYKDCDVSASASLRGFGDAGSVSPYAVPSMQWAVGAELINGMDGNLKPKGTATRAQVATILMRFCENVAN